MILLIYSINDTFKIISMISLTTINILIITINTHD